MEKPSWDMDEASYLAQGQQETVSFLEAMMVDQVKSSPALHLHAHN